jgi:hypothetical protein
MADPTRSPQRLSRRELLLGVGAGLAVAADLGPNDAEASQVVYGLSEPDPRLLWSWDSRMLLTDEGILGVRGRGPLARALGRGSSLLAPDLAGWHPEADSIVASRVPEKIGEPQELFVVSRARAREPWRLLVGRSFAQMAYRPVSSQKSREVLFLAWGLAGRLPDADPYNACHLCLVNVDTRAVRLLPFPPGTRQPFLWSPRTNLVLIARLGGSTATRSPERPLENTVLDLAASKETPIHVAGSYGWGPANACWSPQGDRLAIALRPSGLYVWRRGVPGLQHVFAGQDPYRPILYHPTWSPDGEKVAVGAYQRSSGALLVIDLAAGTAHQLHTAAGVEYPSWSPDGSFIAFRDDYKRRRRIGVIEPRVGSRARTLAWE